MRALICSTRMPEYDRECGSKRVFDLLQCLSRAGWSITFVAQQMDPLDRYATLLRQSGIPTYAGLDTLSEAFLAEAQFDLAILAFWHVAEQCLPPLRRFSPYTRVVIDSIDLHFLRSARRVFQTARVSSPADGLGALFGEECVRELNTYAAADAVLAVSQKETDLVCDLLGDSGAAHWVPLCEEPPPSQVPFAERKGLLFVGNFWHQPNVDAATYLVDDILPKLSPRLLAEHPLWVVGNASEQYADRLRDNPAVRVVGWVPSLLPYLGGVRATVVPLRYGAGTKGKLLQSLVVGTPVVSTALGVEGLGLERDRDFLLGDDASGFASGIERLLTDKALWQRLAQQGARTLTAVHGRDAVAARFLNAIGTVFERSPKPAMSFSGLPSVDDPYTRVRDDTKSAIEATVPVDSTVAIISKGDNDLIALQGRRGEHFPRLDDGRYAGAYPADGPAAVRAIERARTLGAQFLVIPATAAWWLDYYKEFAAFLDAHASCLWQDPSCRIYSLVAAGHALAPREPLPIPALTRVLPKGAARAKPAYRAQVDRPVTDAALTLPVHLDQKPRVLALGIYMLGQPNHAADEVAILRATETCDLDQQWVALGGDAPPELADVTVKEVFGRTPKFQILNELLAKADLSQYEYVMVLDDDVILPNGFVDSLISVQRGVDFALAQPARTSDSYYDHPIVEQQRGVIARRTMFVEIGPVFCVHSSIFDLLFPFDETSSMGWGYESVWAYRLRERGIRMGIIDAVPVSHSLRRSVVNYQWHTANAEQQSLLAQHPHVALEDCFRVLEIVNFDEA